MLRKIDGAKLKAREELAHKSWTRTSSRPPLLRQPAKLCLSINAPAIP